MCGGYGCAVEPRREWVVLWREGDEPWRSVFSELMTEEVATERLAMLQHVAVPGVTFIARTFGLDLMREVTNGNG